MFAEIKPNVFINISHIRKITVEVSEDPKSPKELVIHYSKEESEKFQESNGITVENMITIITTCIELDNK